MEPGFYRCKACGKLWERMEYKTRPNPPRVCPGCGSVDQGIDEAKETAYVKDVYGPLAQMLAPPWLPATDGRTCRRCKAVNPAPQEDCPLGEEIMGGGTEPHDFSKGGTG